VGFVEIKEAKEILKAGAAWANWTDEQRKAMQIAYKSMCDVESVREFCTHCDADERSIQPFEVLDLIK
jgi:hypothetical protein